MSDQAYSAGSPAFVTAGGMAAPASLESGLLRHGSIEAFRAAAPLPIDAQRQIDNAVIRVGMERLTIVQDLINAGLVYPLPNWLGVQTVYNEKTGRAGNARRSMVPKTRGERFVLDREGVTIPVYATTSDYSFDIRSLMAAQRAGAPLETSHTEAAVRAVNEAFEDQAINGLGFNVDGNTADGFLTNPVNTFGYVDNQSWTNTNHSGEDILADVLGMIEDAQDDFYYGPYNLYIPKAYWMKLMTDYKSATSGTILERLQMPGLTIKVADMLPADRTILVQMTSNVVDVIVGQVPTALSWEDGPGLERFFLILGCAIVRIKSDYAGRAGIVVGNLTA